MSVMEIPGETAGLAERIDGLESFNRHVSHDLRGPLVTVSGLAQMACQALARGEPESALGLLGLVTGRVEDVLRLLRDLSTLVDVDGPLQHVRLDLNEIARSAIEEARATLQAGARAQVRLLPLPAAWGSPTLLRQVYVNLVANALKFSCNAADPLIELGVIAGESGPVLYVSDNGVGFDGAAIERLFHPFERLHGNAFAGHGIGLSLVKRVIERHGGHVWAAPHEPSGAAFYFTLRGLC